MDSDTIMWRFWCDVLTKRCKHKVIDSKPDADVVRESRAVDSGHFWVQHGNAGIKHPPEIEGLPSEYIHLNSSEMVGKGRRNRYQHGIVNAFKYGWDAYRQWAWGRDELKPINKSYTVWFDLGLTIVDSLDTLWIMNLHEEFELARDWVSEMIFDRPINVSLFEVTIRVLGGLLSAHSFSGDKVFLDKARELGDRLLPAFTSPSGIPYNQINLATGEAQNFHLNENIPTSEAGSLQLEFSELTFLTCDDKYRKAAMKAFETIHLQPKLDGLVPIFVNTLTGELQNGSMITVGGMVDSYYEYLVKVWLQSGKSINWVLRDFLDVFEGITKQLVRRSEPSKLLYLGDLADGHKFVPKMHHLSCFLPGVLILAIENNAFGSDEEGKAKAKEALEVAAEQTYTCYKMYDTTPTGLSPESVYFNMEPDGKDDIMIKPEESSYMLRPEAVESLFYLYRHTKDPKYREWGWRIFLAIEAYAKLPDGGGYSNLDSVLNANERNYKLDKMESFFLAETLKYLYLLFSDDPTLLPFDKWVFNTEAHPLPIRSKKELKQFLSSDKATPAHKKQMKKQKQTTYNSTKAA